VKKLKATFSEKTQKAIGATAKTLTDTLVSGTQATRANLDEQAELEEEIHELSVKKRTKEEEEEFKKLLKKKSKLEEEQAEIAAKSAGDFISSSLGAVANVFAPGSGPFVTALLQMLQDPEAFKAFIDAFADAVPEIVAVMVSNFPEVAEALIGASNRIVEGLINKFGDGVNRAFIDILESFGVDVSSTLDGSVVNFGDELKIRWSKPI